jgi:hypothetical protein
MLQTKWIIYAGWSLFGFFLVGIGIGLSWGQTAIMAMVASFAILSAIRLDRQWRAEAITERGRGTTRRAGGSRSGTKPTFKRFEVGWRYFHLDLVAGRITASAQTVPCTQGGCDDQNPE